MLRLDYIVAVSTCLFVTQVSESKAKKQHVESLWGLESVLFS